MAKMWHNKNKLVDMTGYLNAIFNKWDGNVD